MNDTTEEKLLKEIERIDSLRYKMTKEQWLHSQLKLNFISIEARLQQHRETKKEILERVHVYFRTKINYCEKPETAINKALIYFVKQMKDEIIKEMENDKR